MVSVIMSVYNETEQELKKSIESILFQTYTDFELIIVNDNPNSESMRAILDTYSTNEKVVILANEKNMGLARSLNNGISAAKGEYIARMDADDIAVPNRIQLELDFLKQYNLDLVCGNAVYIDENGEPLDNSKQRKGYFCTDLSKFLPYTNPIMHPTVLGKTNAFKDMGGYRNFPCAQDYDMWLRMASKGKKIGSLDTIVLYYRIRPNSIGQKNSFKQYLTHQYGLQMFKERQKNGGVDSYTEQSYKNYLVKHHAEDKSSIVYYQKVRQHCDLFIESLKNKKIMQAICYACKACCFNSYGYKILYSIFMVGILKKLTKTV